MIYSPAFLFLFFIYFLYLTQAHLFSSLTTDQKFVALLREHQAEIAELESVSMCVFYVI